MNMADGEGANLGWVWLYGEGPGECDCNERGQSGVGVVYGEWPDLSCWRGVA